MSAFEGKADMRPCESSLLRPLDHLRTSAFAVAIGGKADMAYCTAYVCL